MSRVRLQKAVKSLRATYGSPEPPGAVDPWDLILWENVAYLADDERRRAALAVLRKRVGTRPEQILSAPYDALLEVASYGIMPELRVEKLRRCAQIALQEFDGDLEQVFHWPLPKAKKAFQKFPGIGEPGAEKILLFCHRQAILALESNGLRVLLRLGYGSEGKSYASTYRLVQEAVADELRKDHAWLVAAYLLLRRHGQELCRNSQPRCHRCPLATECHYYARVRVD